MFGLLMIVGGAFIGASKAVQYMATFALGTEAWSSNNKLKNTKRMMRLGVNTELEKKRLEKRVALMKRGIPALDQEEESKRSDFLPVVLRDEDLPNRYKNLPRRMCLTENELWSLFAKMENEDLRISIDDLVLVSESRLADQELRAELQPHYLKLESNS